MTLRITIHDHRPPIRVETAGQLDEVLHAASEEARMSNMLAAVRIEADNSNCMIMVVGGEETVLSFDYGHRNPPYYASKGLSDCDDPVMTCYLSFQHHTEFPRKYVIPFSDGVKAVTQFLDFADLPTCINWEEV